MLIPLLCAALWAQTGVSGTASGAWVQLENGCDGSAVVLELYADVSGLSGDDAVPVGVNAFLVTLAFDRPDVFASAVVGSDPLLDWGFSTSKQSQIDQTQQVTLLGWVADPNAPNQNYHLATVTLAGTPGPVSLTVTRFELGTRVVDGAGAQLLLVDAPNPLSVSIPDEFPRSLAEAVPLWNSADSIYDGNQIAGVDVADLVTVVNCGG